MTNFLPVKITNFISSYLASLKIEIIIIIIIIMGFQLLGRFGRN